MRKMIIIIFLLVTAGQVTAQADKDSAELVKRLDIFMQYNNQMDFDKVMDYVYPKVFTIAPRKEVQASMEEAFSNEELGIKMDSLKIERVYPLFSEGKNKYARVTYSMLILMTPKTDDDDSTGINSFLDIMQGQYGKENVRLDITGKTILISQKVDMAAIRDDLSPEWTFLNIVREDPTMEMLLSKNLIERFYKD